MKKITVHITVNTVDANAQVRKTWGFLKPITRVVKSKKAYSRKGYKAINELQYE